jgi:hypothetical protein
MGDRYLNRIVDDYEKGTVKPITPITAFDAENVHEAFRFMQKGQHIGKIVIRFPENANDLPTAPSREKLLLKPDVSYFQPGGLGGLGQAIAVWMVDHGARHLIFLSRSGAKNVDPAFFEELGDLGCTTQVFTGDLAKLEDVERAVKQAEKPIAGVMQMAMVLRVGSPFFFYVHKNSLLTAYLPPDRTVLWVRCLGPTGERQSCPRCRRRGTFTRR